VVMMASGVLGQGGNPIPDKFPGHLMGNPMAPVMLECYYDHMCQDSAYSWPIVQQVQQMYGADQLLLNVHMFTLPYFRNSFWVQQGGDIITQNKGENVFFQYLDAIFQNQLPLTGTYTMNITSNDVINLLADNYATQFIDKETFMAGMAFYTQYEDDIIVNWKFAASRGVFGTPTFAVNGVFAPQVQYNWTVNDWQQFLEPLFQDSKLAPGTHARKTHHHNPH